MNITNSSALKAKVNIKNMKLSGSTLGKIKSGKTVYYMVSNCKDDRKKALWEPAS